MTALTPTRAGRFGVPCPPPDVLPRPALYERLEQHPLTAVVAAAGFGKTTLMSSWLSARPGHDATWLTLHAGDRDPVRLVADLLSAFGAVGAGSADNRWRRLRPPPAVTQVRTSVEGLLEIWYEHNTPLTLVLDDAQALGGAEESAQVLEHLLRWAPSTGRVVVASRHMPQIRLQRLRVEGRLGLLTHADLAFTAAETVRAVSSAGVDLPGPQVADLHAFTGGWPAGIRLALLAIRARGSALSVLDLGRHAAVADYLMSEVLSGLGEPVRQFVLEATIDDQVCADLVAAQGVPHGGHPLVTEDVHQVAQIGGEGTQRVVAGGLVGIAMPEQVRGDHVNVLGQRGNDRIPGGAAAGDPVDQQDDG